MKAKSIMLIVVFALSIFTGTLIYADEPVKQCQKMQVEYDRKCGKTTNPYNFTQLKQPGDCAEVTVLAKSHWNASRLLLEKGRHYRFDILNADGKDSATTGNSNQGQWCDGSIITNAQGWYIDNKGNQPGGTQCPAQCSKCKHKKAVRGGAVNLGGLSNAMIKGAGLIKRKRDANWFALIGVIDGPDKTEFTISDGLQQTAAVQGEFCAYANDVAFKYGNNSGAIVVRVTAQE